MKKTLLAMSMLVAATGVAMGSAAAFADDAPSSATAGAEGTKLANAYASFAGSSANAQALVDGLRSGTAVVLVTPATATTPATQITFTPDTHKMGYGNVNLALALAQADLAKQGITQPTTAQLAAALNGGVVTTASGPVQLSGVLALRSKGEGWGEVSKTLGLKLGTVEHEAKAHGPLPDRDDIARGDKAADKADKAADKADKAADKADKAADKADKAADKADKVADAHHVDKPDRPEKVDRPDKPERPEKPEHAGR